MLIQAKYFESHSISQHIYFICSNDFYLIENYSSIIYSMENRSRDLHSERKFWNLCAKELLQACAAPAAKHLNQTGSRCSEISRISWERGRASAFGGWITYKRIAYVKCVYVHVQRAPAFAMSSVIITCSTCEREVPSDINGNNKDIINPKHAIIN